MQRHVTGITLQVFHRNMVALLDNLGETLHTRSDGDDAILDTFFAAPEDADKDTEEGTFYILRDCLDGFMTEDELRTVIEENDYIIFWS